MDGRSENSNYTFMAKLAFKIAMILLISGGLNWLCVGMFGKGAVHAIFGKGFLSTAIYIAIGISAIAIMFDRDTYLPFLGPMVAPCSALAERTPSGATRSLRITAPPGAKVLYWASEPEMKGIEQINTWKDAYGKYDNAGVTTADESGVAVLRVRGNPQPYSVPLMGRIESHVHYRVCDNSGFMGRIKTIFLSDLHVEGFGGGGLLFSN